MNRFLTAPQSFRAGFKLPLLVTQYASFTGILGFIMFFLVLDVVVDLFYEVLKHLFKHLFS